MPRNDNYPEDIRSFDHAPGSPFYVDPDDGLEDEIVAIRSDLDGLFDCNKVQTVKQQYSVEPIDVLEKLNETTFGIIAIEAALDDLAEYIARKKRTDMEESF